MKKIANQQIRPRINIDLKPSASQLRNLDPLWTAIDTLIVHNCFTDNNPMRRNPEDTLLWDWTIVTVDDFSMPAPIHRCSETESVLYAFNGDEVIMSNAECAHTTAFFYIDHLLCCARGWERMQVMLSPFLCTLVKPGIDVIRDVCEKTQGNVITTLKRSLTYNGIRILE